MRQIIKHLQAFLVLLVTWLGTAAAAPPPLSPFEEEAPVPLRSATPPPAGDTSLAPFRFFTSPAGPSAAGPSRGAGPCATASCAATTADCRDCSAVCVDGCCNCPNPGVIGYVDYLNWKARMSGLDFAKFSPVLGGGTVATESLDFQRESGFRAGIGYAFASGWDLTFNFTHFRTDDQQAFVPPVTAPALPQVSLLSTRSLFSTQPLTAVEADGSLKLNIYDVEASWRPALNDWVDFRPFGGVRWATLEQQFNTSYSYFDAVLQQTVHGTVNLPMDMDAAGLRLGAELQWRTAGGLRLYGRAAQSLLVADFRTRQREVNSAFPAGPILDAPEHDCHIVPVLEAAAGLAWSRGPIEVSAGYEMSNWFNMFEVGRGNQNLFIDGYFLRLAYIR